MLIFTVDLNFIRYSSVLEYENLSRMYMYMYTCTCRFGDQCEKQVNYITCMYNVVCGENGS